MEAIIKIMAFLNFSPYNLKEERRIGVVKAQCYKPEGRGFDSQ
jgi:hypothetical protein